MSIHVSIDGKGHDLVLLHGWAMHGGVFADLVPLLTHRFRVHVIDLPGHGKSSGDQRVVSLSDMSDRVRPHVPANAIVTGWSLGGQVALRLATQTNLRAMVLVSATPKFVADPSWPHGMAPDVFAQFFAQLHANLESTVQNFLSLQVRGDIHAMHTLKALRQRLMEHPPQAQMLETSLAMLRDTDLRSLLTAIPVPTLLIAGDHDRITHPRATHAMQQHLPHSQYVEIRRAGHACFLSHRDEFLNALNQFVAHLPDERAA